MCTSVISNRKKTIVGFNLDLMGMVWRVHTHETYVAIEILDESNRWLPLFGANHRGEFVGMPTCWPYDEKSEPSGSENVITMDINLLTEAVSFTQTKEYVEHHKVDSMPGVTYMSQISDDEGNVLQIIPGQGYRYLEKPTYCVMTNFSPFKMDKEQHPWMGWDRYQTATQILQTATEDFGVNDCMDLLRQVAQTACPTIVSMVYDVEERVAYWVENQEWDQIKSHSFKV